LARNSPRKCKKFFLLKLLWNSLGTTRNMGTSPLSESRQWLKEAFYQARRLSTCPVPVCTACLYCKAHKKPQRSKPSDEEREAIRSVTKPGECVYELT